MTFGQYKVYFVLMLLVILSWFMADFFEQKISIKQPVKAHSPDYFSQGYFKKEMALDGLLKSELLADKMTHYSDDNTTHLENAVMTLYNPAGIPPWVIQAEQAVLEADGDHIQMMGKVLVQREGTKNLRAFVLNTSNLKVKLSTQYAQTKQWAEVIDAKNRTQGVGMNMTFGTPVKIKFLSKVKGRYVFN